MEFSFSMGIAHEPGNGFKLIFDPDVGAEANFGLIFGTVETHHFHGTHNQYQNSTNVSFYYGLGAGPLMGPANSEGIVFGGGFGGKWLEKIPFGQNTIQAVKHKGFSVSQDTGAF